MSKGNIVDMESVREIIYRLRMGHSKRRIERELKVYRKGIRKIYKTALEYQWLDPKSPLPSCEAIAKAFGKRETTLQHSLDPFHEQLAQWYKAGHSAVVIQRLLEEKCPCNIQAIRRYLKKKFPQILEPVMVRTTLPGQDLDVDFGYLGLCHDDSGTPRKAYLFSLRLRHSRKAYREVVLNQNTETFLSGHINAFEFFGGVPTHVIIDNTKAAVLQSTVDNEKVRRSYQELAEHYGCIITPCLPRTPEHKGGVESDVKYVKRNFLAFFREKLKEQNRETPSIDYLREELKLWEKEVADQRVVYGVGRTPEDLFELEEQPALRTLPVNRWELTSWSSHVVRRDWRILLENNWYSVPYKLIGQKVEVCITQTLVRIFHEHKEVACHSRLTGKWQCARRSEFAPPAEEEVLQTTRSGLIHQSECIGPYTHQMVNAILSHPSVNKLHPARRLLNLSKKYSNERLERACQRACTFKLFSYGKVKTILENELDCETPSVTKIIPLDTYRFARNPADYGSLERLAMSLPSSKHSNAMAGFWKGMMADQTIEEESKEKK